jgi:hypothetical protein
MLKMKASPNSGACSAAALILSRAMTPISTPAPAAERHIWR